LLAAMLLSAQDFEAPQQTEYKGPAVLSRGRMSSFPSAFQSIRLRPVASVSSIYSTNFQQQGAAVEPSYNDLGVTLYGGIFGTQQWRRKSLTVGYSGGYTHYKRLQSFNGPEQQLTLDFTWQLSPRFAVMLRELGGISNRSLFSNFYVYGASPWDYIPRDEAFDNRLYFSNSQASLVFRKSARLSYSVGADHFIQYRASSLPSVRGYRTRADVNYRTSRYVTVGAHYDYTMFSFTRGVGNSGFHTVGIDYSQRIGRSWEAAASIGGSLLESTGIVRRQVDPEVAWIIGQQYTNQVLERSTLVPRGRVVLTRKFRRGIAGGELVQDVNPGNGLLLTSRGFSANGFASYNWSSKVSMHYSGGWQRRSGLLPAQIRAITGYTGSLGVAYNIGAGLSFTSNANYFNQKFDGITPRNWIQVSAGLSYHPSDFPLAFW
jgi:hypothetical protein